MAYSMEWDEMEDGIFSQWCSRRGCRGWKRIPKSVYLLKVQEKISETLGKISENLCEIHENLGKSSTQLCLTSKLVSKFEEKQMKPFFGRRTKKGLHDFCGRMFVGKSRATPFWASLGKFGQNPSHSQNVLAPTPMSTIENWISEVWNGRSHVRMEKVIHTCSFSCLLNRLFSDFLPDKQQAIAKTCQMRRCENITRSAHLRSWSKDRSKQRSLL